MQFRRLSSLLLALLLLPVPGRADPTRVPTEAAVVLAEVEALLRMGASEKALARLSGEAAARLPLARREALRARALLALERAEEAEESIQAALEAEPESLPLYLVAAQVYALQGKKVPRLMALQRAVQLDPDSGEAHFQLALAYDDLDNSPKVLEHAQKAIRIDPANKERLKPRIAQSNVSRKIGKIVTQVLRDSKFERLDDDRIQGYAEEIGKILGEGRTARPAPSGKSKMKKILEELRKKARVPSPGTGRKSRSRMSEALREHYREKLGNPEAADPAEETPALVEDEEESGSGSWFGGAGEP